MIYRNPILFGNQMVKGNLFKESSKHRVPSSALRPYPSKFPRLFLEHRRYKGVPPALPAHAAEEALPSAIILHMMEGNNSYQTSGLESLKKKCVEASY